MPYVKLLRKESIAGRLAAPPLYERRNEDHQVVVVMVHDFSSIVLQKYITRCNKRKVLTSGYTCVCLEKAWLLVYNRKRISFENIYAKKKRKKNNDTRKAH